MTEEMCRICLSKDLDGSMLNIFIEDKIMISTKIMVVAKVKVYQGDGLPTMICQKCLTLLNSCLYFINLCQDSDLKLRASVKDKEDMSKTDIDTYDSVNSDDNSLKTEQDFTDEVVELHESRTNMNVQKDEQKYNQKKGKKQQCSVCGRVMSSTYRLKTHLMTHIEDRPFSCSHCNKRFSLPENLKVHLRIHTGEKPLTCLICGESFAQSSGLIAHRRKHTGQLPYKCKLCSRSFRTIGHLQYHTKRHTGEKKFECDTCGRGFITRGDLKQHLATHTGDRPHVCTICGMRLTRASNLKRHIQQLHSNPEVRPSKDTTNNILQCISNESYKGNEENIK